MTIDREEQIQMFLQTTSQSGIDWSSAERRDLTADASNRRYERLSSGGNIAVLMDAPPDKGEDVRPFVQIARYLDDLNLSAPKIHATDETRGFLLIEDLGDDLYAKVVQRTPDKESELYIAAIDALLEMQTLGPKADLPNYGSPQMIDAAQLLLDWYIKVATEAVLEKQEFRALFEDLFAEHFSAEQVMVHRDYHAENLIWLPNRQGARRVGILDFQDAAWGHPAYDLASLLKDARRDVPEQIQKGMLAYFIQRTHFDADAFQAAYALCSVQRNMRIIGVFTRLCARDGKRHYPAMIPRVWRNLQDDLSHPALSKLQHWCQRNIPEPSDAILSRITQSHA